MTAPQTTILYVRDLTQSLAFYQQLLGAAPLEATETFALFALNEGAMLGLWHQDKVVPPCAGSTQARSELCFPMPDRDTLLGTCERLAAQGVDIAQSPTEMPFGLTFLITDPDQHRIRYLLPN
ncbi:VOC family protein [Photobacterium sp. MCCC 1A19761]|uniref:VOC family protein n=1 Tax=Photobacterium sp. MCCC 1A19761 TaxID=3115000 RepID=UPI00307DFCAC